MNDLEAKCLCGCEASQHVHGGGCETHDCNCGGFRCESRSVPAALKLYVIYNNPKDYPEKFVCRVWYLHLPGETWSIGDTLEEVRATLPFGLHNLGRFDSDEPVIAETWV